MARANAIFTMHAPGLTRTRRRLAAGEKEMDRVIRDDFEDAQRIALSTFRQHAQGGPRSRLARGLKVLKRGRAPNTYGFNIHSTARDPVTGYDYLAVTRFGHRRAWITPRSDRGAASTIASGRLRAPQSGRPPALRIPLGGGVGAIFRARVRGFRPTHDWVAVAGDRMSDFAQAMTVRLGRKIARRVL